MRQNQRRNRSRPDNLLSNGVEGGLCPFVSILHSLSLAALSTYLDKEHHEDTLQFRVESSRTGIGGRDGEEHVAGRDIDVGIGTGDPGGGLFGFLG